jgi:hypothetical protein
MSYRSSFAQDIRYLSSGAQAMQQDLPTMRMHRPERSSLTIQPAFIHPPTRF